MATQTGPRRRKVKARGKKDVKFSITMPIELKQAVEAEAAERAIPASEIYRDAIRSRYSPDRANQEQNLILRDLRTMRRELRRVEFGQRVVTEFFVTAAKNILAALPPITGDGQKRGQAFYNHMLSEVEKVLSADKGVLDKLPEHLARYDADSFAELEVPATSSEPTA